jgi:hypothetical protein
VSATPTMLEDVIADFSPAGGGLGIIRTKGIHIPPGTSKTFPVGFISDSPTPGPFSLRVAEAFYPDGLEPIFGVPGHLTISLDKTSGVNGEIAYVTVTVKTAGQRLAGYRQQTPVNYPKLNFITLLASYNGNTSRVPVLIVTTP